MTDAIARAEVAKRILEDEVFTSAVADVAKAITRQWSVETNAEKREELWAQQRALTNVINNLTACMQDGEMKKLKMDKKGLFR